MAILENGLLKISTKELEIQKEVSKSINEKLKEVDAELKIAEGEFEKDVNNKELLNRCIELERKRYNLMKEKIDLVTFKGIDLNAVKEITITK